MLNRLFKYRCSYMVYSLSFANLVPQLKTTVLANLWAALQGNDPQKRYSYLSASERKNIARILAETLPGAPVEWRQTVARR